MAELTSLFGKPPKRSNIEFIRPFTGYESRVFRAKENGKDAALKHFSYETPIAYFEKCIILGGMYPFDPHGNFWYGTTYFQSGLELPNYKGLAPISKKNLELLGIHKQSDEHELFKRVVLINGRGNFGHFLFEIIGKFFAVRDLVNSDYIFLVSDDVPDRFLEFLPLIGISKKRIKKYPKFKTFAAEEVVVPAVPAHRFPGNQMPSLDTCLFHRMVSEIKSCAKTLPLEQNQVNQSSYLFIGRSKEKWRRLENEKDITSEFKKYFPIYELNPSSLDAKDQVLSYDNARLVCTVVGGASPTIMFCKRGSIIVELISPNFAGDWGARIWCALLGLNYWRITGSFSENNVNKGTLPIDQDFSVSLKAFTEIIKIIKKSYDNRIPRDLSENL